LREDGSGDIGSLWLNLIAPDGEFYQSTITLKPSVLKGGIVASVASYVPCIAEHLWVRLDTALMAARHTLGFKEYNRVVEGTIPGFATAYDAFSNPQWCAGNIYCATKTAVGLDDIQAKVGYDVYAHDAARCAVYGILTLPTGKKSSAHYLFQPTIGSKHMSFGVGCNSECLCYEDEMRALTWLCDASYRYVASAHERRSFDLIRNGDWSRYMQIASQAEPFYSQPGINAFTKETKVTPGSTGQLWAAFNYAQASWRVEVGYNLWLRGREKISLTTCEKTLPFGIFDLTGVCDFPPTSGSSATISQSSSGPYAATKDLAYTPVTLADFNRCSAANKRAISNTVYCAGSYAWAESSTPIALGGGVSFEKAAHYNALNHVAVWLDTTLRF